MAREDPDSTTQRGVQAIKTMWDSWLESYPDLQLRGEEVIPAGDRVFVWVRITGRGAASGAEVEMQEAYVYTFRDGKVVRVEEYFDRREGLQAAGLSMAQRNFENLRAFLETWSREAWTLEAWQRGEVFDMSLLDPEIAYEDTVLPDHAGEAYRGHEGVVRAGERWIESSEWLLVELEQIVGAGDRLVSIHRVRSKARHTGIEFETPLAYVWTFRDGKVIHFRSFLDPEEALEAAGFG